jgi:Protein of unknown function (DUF992)
MFTQGESMVARVRSWIIAILILAVLACVPRAAAAQEKPKATVRAGYLTCYVSSGWGFVIGSSRALNCSYSAKPGYTEFYTGSISKFGVDIGYLRSGVILWTVLAPTTDLGPGALAGHYAGATASVALGVGIGANVLIGGFKKSIALQPVAIEAQNGLNVAAGISELDLHFVAALKADIKTSDAP